MKGLVIKSTGSWYKVVAEDGDIIDCQIKGKFRLKGLRTTNPIAVGDQVQFQMEEDGTGVIHTIEDRKNYIIRKSVNLSKQAHIVASNVDKAYLVVTLKEPPTSMGFIDRFLITAEAYSIPVTILFNKIDVYDDKAIAKRDHYQQIYESIGYETMTISATRGDGLEALRDSMKSQINLMSGHSGVGKSTLINRLLPDVEIKTSEVSEYHKKGKHTTTFAEMHAMPKGGWLVDTPGIKGFGIIDIPKDELHHHFKEFFALLPECKFHNCLHLNEPGCAVKAAVNEGIISVERYESYLMMYHEDENDTYR
ncbi:MAG: ribosome small subunit-dependent GTPase A [Flavobacteriales bacterium]|nr:ribosome small subunit-dependent GTPase A [Flavobacteriales bacterium]